MSGSEADAHANRTLQSAQDEEARLNRLIGLLHAARDAIGNVVLGQEQVAEQMLIGLMGSGHVLLEGRRDVGREHPHSVRRGLDGRERQWMQHQRLVHFLTEVLGIDGKAVVGLGVARNGDAAGEQHLAERAGRNGIASAPRAWSSSCLVRRCRRNKAKGPTHSDLDQPCVAEQSLAWSIRTALLS